MPKPISAKALNGEFSNTLVAASIKGAMQAAGAGSRDLWQIDPTKLHVIEGLNPRVMNEGYKAHIRALADSMKSEGFYQDQPLAGYAANIDGEPVVCIYGGHSRLLAVELANSEGAEITRVPVTVSQVGLSMEDITVALIRGNGGKELTYYESAIVCKRLVKYGFEIEEIATRTGITAPLVKHRLTLMAAPLKLREMVANESMSATLALEMIAKHGEKVMEHIESAKARADEAGKDRVKKAQCEPTERFKFVKKSAPKLYVAAGAVQRDPGYLSLSSETRTLLEELLKEIEGKAGNDDDFALAKDPRQLEIAELAVGTQQKVAA
jgi:ParB family chromosome partitioning protein